MEFEFYRAVRWNKWRTNVKYANNEFFKILLHKRARYALANESNKEEKREKFRALKILSADFALWLEKDGSLHRCNKFVASALA